MFSSLRIAHKWERCRGATNVFSRSCVHIMLVYIEGSVVFVQRVGSRARCARQRPISPDAFATSAPPHTHKQHANENVGRNQLEQPHRDAFFVPVLFASASAVRLASAHNQLCCRCVVCVCVRVCVRVYKNRQKTLSHFNASVSDGQGLSRLFPGQLFCAQCSVRLLWICVQLMLALCHEHCTWIAEYPCLKAV